MSLDRDDLAKTFLTAVLSGPLGVKYLENHIRDQKAVEAAFSMADEFIAQSTGRKPHPWGK